MSRKRGKEPKQFSEYRNGARPKVIGFKEKTREAIEIASSTNWREFKNFVEHFLDQVAGGNIKYRLPGTSLWADINCGELGIIPSHADGAFAEKNEQDVKPPQAWLVGDEKEITEQHLIAVDMRGAEPTATKRKWKKGRKGKLRIKIKDESKQHSKRPKLLTTQRDGLTNVNIFFKETTFDTLTKASEKSGRNLKNFVEHLLDQFAGGHIKYRVPGTNLWVDIYNAKTPIDAVSEVEVSPVVIPMEAMQNANEPIVNIPSTTEPINNSTGTGDHIIINPTNSIGDGPHTIQIGGAISNPSNEEYTDAPSTTDSPDTTEPAQ